jgi:hypothetical protein
MLFTHKFYSGRAALLRRPNFSIKAEPQFGPTVFTWATKKPRLTRRRGDKTFMCSSHFSQADDAGLELAPDIET